MKSIIPFLAIVTLFLFSCGKTDEPIPSNDAVASMSYKVNDSLVKITGNLSSDPNKPVVLAERFDKEETGRDYTFYMITGIDPNVHYLSLELITDTLAVGTYHWEPGQYPVLNVQNNVELGSLIGSVNQTGDFVDVTITSNSKGVIAGTFRMKATEIIGGQPAGKISVTEGKFKDVHVFY